MILSERTVLVTGASGGIGLVVAKSLGAAGAKVIAQWRSNREGAEAAVEEIPNDRRHLIQADLSNLSEVGRVWSEAAEWAGGVDVLVNNAGVLPRAGIGDRDEDWNRAWELALTVNVRGPAELMRLATNHFLHRGGGVLVTLSSWVAHRGSSSPNLIAYAASKAAITAATKTIARSYAESGVLAYCIAPGPVATGMTSTAAQDQGGEDAVRASLAMKELVPPSELADIVIFLATGRVRHLTGATLDVTGASYIR